jgi:hypothetical protein
MFREIGDRGFVIQFASNICLQKTPNPENSLTFKLKNRKFKITTRFK